MEEKKRIRLCRYESPVGPLEIGEDGEGICRISFGKADSLSIKGNAAVQNSEEASKEQLPRKEQTPLLQEAIRQLKEYFAGQRKSFDLPLSFYGTEFQKKVWQALLDIPYGETRSYGQIAAAVGNPKACRAVGMANHRNEIIIVVPCHRVIGADGSLTGYGGGLDVKRKLLELEGIRWHS